jgi:RNA polymerase sigma-70 factor (ECF subfamily)
MNTTERQKSFEKQIGNLRNFVVAVAMKYVRNFCDAEDIAQIVLMKAWKSFDRLPTIEGNLKRWLYVVAKRSLRDFYRMRSGQDKSTAVLDITGSYLELSHDTLVPLSVCESVPFRDPFVLSAVNSFLQELPAMHRRVLLLSACDFTYCDIATATGASLGTVRSRLHYARKKARRALASCR